MGIARAFVAKPKVIFADEPTGNLDSTTSRQVLYSMLEMAKSYGITFVMVTHEKELAYCGDRIVTIKDGRVLDNVLLGEDEKAENRRRLFGDVTSGDIAEPETTVEEEKKPRNAAKAAWMRQTLRNLPVGWRKPAWICFMWRRPIIQAIWRIPSRLWAYSPTAFLRTLPRPRCAIVKTNY